MTAPVWWRLLQGQVPAEWPLKQLRLPQFEGTPSGNTALFLVTVHTRRYTSAGRGNPTVVLHLPYKKHQTAFASVFTSCEILNCTYLLRRS